MGLESEISALANEINAPDTDATDDNNNIENDGDNIIDDTISDDVSDGDSEIVGSAPETNEEITTIAQLSEAIGWEAEDLYSMQVGMGDNQEAIPLGQLKDNYQTAVKDKAALETQLADAVKLNESAQAGLGQQQQVSQQMQEAQANLAAIQQQYNSYNWQEAEQDDPGQAALNKQKFNEMYNNAQGQVQQIQQQQQQFANQQLQQSAVKLKQLIPEWGDPEIMQTGQKAIKSLLANAGYTDDMINGMADPVAVSLMNELVQLRAEKAGAKEALKQTRQAPKVLKGGGVKRNRNSNADALANKAINSGDRNDQIAAVKALF